MMMIKVVEEATKSQVEYKMFGKVGILTNNEMYQLRNGVYAEWTDEKMDTVVIMDLGFNDKCPSFKIPADIFEVISYELM